VSYRNQLLVAECDHGEKMTNNDGNPQNGQN